MKPDRETLFLLFQSASSDQNLSTVLSVRYVPIK